MERGKPSLTIRSCPTPARTSSREWPGQLTIEITGGKHFYELEYTLAE